MKWISVKDRLPSDFDSSCCMHDGCLVKGFSGPGKLVSIAEYDGEKWCILGNEGIYSDCGFFHLSPEEITHWIFLRDLDLEESK